MEVIYRERERERERNGRPRKDTNESISTEFLSMNPFFLQTVPDLNFGIYFGY
jgi:hypothetical protein